MNQIRVSTMGELIALVSYLLGFTPEESVVVVPLSENAPTARLDFPADVAAVLDAAESIQRAYRSCSGPVGLFAFTKNTQAADLVLEAFEAAMPEQVTVTGLVHVDDDRWSNHRTGESGSITQQDRDLVGAAAVMSGKRVPHRTRAEHVDRFARQEVIPMETLTRVTKEMLQETAAERTEAVEAILNSARTTGLMPSDTEVARLLVSARFLVRLPDLRDLKASRETGHADLALWTNVVQRAPETYDRGNALHVAAFCAWLSGDGAVAWTGLDTAKAEEAETTDLSGFVENALTEATNPRTWSAE